MQSQELQEISEIKENVGLIGKFLETLPEKALHLGIRVALAILVFVIGIEVIKIARKILKKSLLKANADKGAIQFIDSFLKAALYVVLVLMIASSFGLDATSILALLGSAGVAIGLAVQGSLSNLAGGILILLVKPFKVGDYIIEDNNKNEGIVTEIQIFYTKLTTFDNKTIVLPNGSLANTSLTNVTATATRRLELRVGIAYSADLQKAKQVLRTILEQEDKIIQVMEKIVAVDELAESAVMLAVRCHVQNEDYWETKCRMLETIKIQFDGNGIEIPFPQMNVHMDEKSK